MMPAGAVMLRRRASPVYVQINEPLALIVL